MECRVAHVVIILTCACLFVQPAQQTLNTLVSANAGVIVEVHPQDAEVSVGDKTILTCKFNQPVNCKWMRNEGEVEISGRYEYIHPSNDDDIRSDCSIRIEPIDDIDFKKWKCSAPSTDLNAAVTSNVANLMEKKKLYIRWSDENTVSGKETVGSPEFENKTLICFGDTKDVSDYKWEQFQDTMDLKQWRTYVDSRFLRSNVAEGIYRCAAETNDKLIYSNEIRVESIAAQENAKFFKESASSSSTFLYTTLAFALVVIVVLSSIIGYGMRSRNRRTKKMNSRNIPEDQQKLVEKKGDTKNDLIISEKFYTEAEIMQGQYRIDLETQLTTYEWTILNVKSTRKLHKTTTELHHMFNESEPFDIRGSRFYMKLRLYFNGYQSGFGSHVSIGFKLFPKSNEVQTAAEDIFYHKRIVMLLDQRKVEEKEKLNIFNDYEPPLNSQLAERFMGDWWQIERFTRQSMLDDKDNFILNDRLKLKVIVEPSSVTAKNFTYAPNGLTWKIFDYTAKKQHEIDGYQPYLKSENFCCQPYGYIFNVVLHLNGYGAGKKSSLSIKCGVIKGPYDEQLPNLFPHKFRFEIVNQKIHDSLFSNFPNLVRTRIASQQELEEIGYGRRLYGFSGMSMVAGHKEIEVEPYLIKDSMVLKIIVEPIQ